MSETASQDRRALLKKIQSNTLSGNTKNSAASKTRSKDKHKPSGIPQSLKMTNAEITIAAIPQVSSQVSFFKNKHTLE